MPEAADAADISYYPEASFTQDGIGDIFDELADADITAEWIEQNYPEPDLLVDYALEASGYSDRDTVRVLEAHAAAIAGELWQDGVTDQSWRHAYEVAAKAGAVGAAEQSLSVCASARRLGMSLDDSIYIADRVLGDTDPEYPHFARFDTMQLSTTMRIVVQKCEQGVWNVKPEDAKHIFRSFSELPPDRREAAHETFRYLLSDEYTDWGASKSDIIASMGRLLGSVPDMAVDDAMKEVARFKVL